MKNNVVAIISIFLLYFLLPGKIFAQVFLTEGHLQPIPAKYTGIGMQGESKTTLIQSIEFSYNPAVGWNQAILFAVPAKPFVEVLPTDDILVAASKSVQTSFQKRNALERVLLADVEEHTYHPPPTHSRRVQIDFCETFDPADAGQTFRTWAKENSYIIPKNADATIDAFIADQWYFVVCIVDLVNVETVTRDRLLVNQAHTAPIKIIYDSPKLVFPLKLLGIQPDFDSRAAPFIDRWYGQTVASLGGQKNDRIDAMLSRPAEYFYPSAIMDLSFLRTDLYILSSKRQHITGYMTLFADATSLHTQLGGGRKQDWLTYVVGFTPFIQLENATPEPSVNTARVNPRISLGEYALRVVGGVIVVLGAATVIVTVSASTSKSHTRKR